MKSRFILFLCAGLSLGAGLARAGELTWFTDLSRAQAQATAEKKAVLLFFHGSDWCPACLEMQRQVLKSPEFVTYARQALVLVDVDFPDKTPQSAALKQANQALREKFNVGENFPTLVLLDGLGQTLYQEAGYAGGGPAAVLPGLLRHVPLPAAVPAAGYADLSVPAFAQMAADKQNVLLDVRTAGEFMDGHIAGAINLDVSAPDFEAQAAHLDKDKTYLVYCASGGRSVRACKKLRELDFRRLDNLSGGFHAWVNAGQPAAK